VICRSQAFCDPQAWYMKGGRWVIADNGNFARSFGFFNPPPFASNLGEQTGSNTSPISFRYPGDFGGSASE